MNKIIGNLIRRDRVAQQEMIMGLDMNNVDMNNVNMLWTIIGFCSAYGVSSCPFCGSVLTRLAIIILQILGIILFFYPLILLLLFSEYPAIILILFLKFAQHILHSRASNTRAGYTT